MTPVFRLLNRTSLVTQIVIGLVAGIALALLAPAIARDLGFLGKVFVSALKAVAPVLVFILVMASIANHRHGQETHIRPILWLYLLGTFAAAVVAVVASMLFPSQLVLSTGEASLSAPGGIMEVMQNLLLSAVDNPINALLKANFIGILTWAIGLGVALRHAGETTRTVVEDLSNGVTLIVRVVIRFAPLGIFGLVSSTLAQSGLSALLGYLHLLAVLIGCMLFVALVMNPLIVFWKIRRNPYPLTLNALVLACNQKTSREPVMNLSQGQVGQALRALEGQQMTRLQMGSRADRWEQRVDKALELVPAQLVLMGLMFLRGPQTLNELLTRSNRLHDFDDTEQIQHQLERLISRGLAVHLPRQAGQREDRYSHALGDPAEIEAILAARQQEGGARSSGSSVSEERIEALEARIAALEARLAELEG